MSIQAEIDKIKKQIDWEETKDVIVGTFFIGSCLLLIIYLIWALSYSYYYSEVTSSFYIKVKQRAEQYPELVKPFMQDGKITPSEFDTLEKQIIQLEHDNTKERIKELTK